MKFSILEKLIIGSLVVLSHFMPHSSYTQHFTRDILTNLAKVVSRYIKKLFATIVYVLKLRNSVRTTAEHTYVSAYWHRIRIEIFIPLTKKVVWFSHEDIISNSVSLLI